MNPSQAVLRRIRRLRWTAYVLGATAFVLAYFHRLAPAAIAGELQRAFDTSGTTLGVLAAAYFYVYFAMQVPSGVLADTWGPRRLFTAGALVAGAGSIIFGLAGTLEVAIAGRLLVGLGVSVAFISVLKLTAAWFSERQFATVTGLLMFIGNMGGLLSAAPLAWIVGFTSWRNVFVAAGALSLGLAALIWALLRDNPRNLGLPTLNEIEGRPEPPPHTSHWLEGLGVVLRNRLTWPGFFMNLGLVGSFLTFAGLWAVPYLREVHGMERTLATYHTSVMVLGFATGSLVVGALSDRMRRRLPLMRALGALYAACWLPFLGGWALPLGASFALCALMGIAIAGATLSWSCAKEVNPPELSGTATSVVNTGGFLGPAIYQPLVGWVLDLSSRGAAHSTGDWQLALGAMSLFTFAGFACTFLIRETHCRNIYSGAS
ncbi:MAG: MFS transporter [Betaproteobacteria bacterium]|nr:MFS transporter [Betaproteobacteria bacterium]